jgi:light-regulated signal transduction histidine kinase (bacteriophytochrome)
MDHVMTNLLSNAIKYSAKKDRPCIKVWSYLEGAEVIYAVRDNGAGFDMAYAGKLFGVFERLHNKSEYDGIGIGLAIVKRVVQRHNGRVWAEGRVNEGATFYFSLPI